MSEKKRVLILCTGNSCRSQMAEGWINHARGEQWEAFSAGTEPSGYVHPLAVAAMQEVSVDISAGVSQSVDAYRGQRFNAVITVCDDAAENCPTWLGEGRRAHISFPDPATATGTESEQMVVFRQVRDDIRRRVLAYLDKIGAEEEVNE